MARLGVAMTLMLAGVLSACASTTLVTIAASRCEAALPKWSPAPNRLQGTIVR